MPADSLAEACNQIGAEILILGVSRVYDSSPGGSLDEYIENLNNSLEPNTKVWVGGVGKGSTFMDQDNLEVIPTLSTLDQMLANLVK